MEAIMLSSGIGNLSLEANTNQNLVDNGVNVDEESILSGLQAFLQPLKTELLIQQRALLGEAKDAQSSIGDSSMIIPLMKSLCQFIWDPDTIFLEKPLIRRSIIQLGYNFLIHGDQSDLEDYLEYRPAELVTFKAIQVFSALILPDVKLFMEEMKNFKNLIQDPRISRDKPCEQAFLFLYSTFERFYELLTGEEDKDKTYEPFENLSPASKVFVRASSVTFAKVFRIYYQERIAKMQNIVKEDDSSFEWCLTLAEMQRLRRRDFRGSYSQSNKSKWVTDEEYHLLSKIMAMAPENPFVRLAIFDTIIGVVRDSSGRFYCGDIRLDSTEEAMRYLYKECTKLTEDFPKNVLINSIISDYYARYFPFLYFNRDISYGLLKTAYALNPLHPKTTHRLGILTRMSFEEILESSDWLKKTLQLDPTHFNGTFEYFKTVLGKTKDNSSGDFVDLSDISKAMQEIAENPEKSSSWNLNERADFLFYLGLAYFIQDKKDAALNYWKEVAKIDEEHFTLSDMLTTCENFKWDSKLITTDKVMLWFQQEKAKYAKMEKSEEPFDPENKKFVDRIFAIMIGLRGPAKQRHLPIYERYLEKDCAKHFICI